MSEKKYAKSFGIVIVIFVFVTIAFYIITLSLFTFTSRWKYNVENFETYKKDFEAVASFCNDYIREQSLQNKTASNWFSYHKRNLYYGEKAINFSDELQNSLYRISDAFKHKDAKLDIIRCNGDVVYFCTHNGQYSLVYSPTNKPTSVSDKVEEDVFVKEISNGWFHVVKNNH